MVVNSQLGYEWYEILNIKNDDGLIFMLGLERAFLLIDDGFKNIGEIFFSFLTLQVGVHL